MPDSAAEGCRILSFRSHPVSLICFCHGQTVANLFIVDRTALATIKPGKAPVFAQEGDWTTANWADRGHAYMIAVHGDRVAVQHYVPDA